MESASIDKRDHASDLCGQIGETLQLDQALRVALDFQRKNRDTLVVVTADHSHTSQIVPEGQDTPGFYATVKTADGAALRVSYGTGKTPPGQSHTGARVPVAAIGPQATNVMGVRDQTDLFHTLIGRGARRTPRPRLSEGAASGAACNGGPSARAVATLSATRLGRRARRPRPIAPRASTAASCSRPWRRKPPRRPDRRRGRRW